MAEKYYGMNGYGYCAENPIRFIDHNGRELVIKGNLSNDALSQLQERTKNRIQLTRDSETGIISYIINKGKRLKGDAKIIVAIINDPNITVNLITTEKNVTSMGNLMIGGAFMGNEVSYSIEGDVHINAFQEVNPIVLGSADDFTHTAGKMLLHEVTESYIGAQITQKMGTGVGPATQTDATNINSVYSRAHNKATPQTPIFQTMYDRYGRIVYYPAQAVKVEWSVKKGNKSKVIQVLQ